MLGNSVKNIRSIVTTIFAASFIKDDREAIKELDDLDVISSNIVQDHVLKLEQFQWFMRSFLID